MLPPTKSHQDLLVWQKGLDLVLEIYALTKIFPREELYGLISQMRRAAVSIVSNIAEGYNRRNRKEYIQFLSIAYGSCAELSTQLVVAERLGYDREKRVAKCSPLLQEVSRMLSVMIQKLQSPQP